MLTSPILIIPDVAATKHLWLMETHLWLWKLILHKSVQLGVSITDQIWLLSRALLCFCSDSLRIKKGELAVLIIIIALGCFLLSSFVQGLSSLGKPLSFSHLSPQNRDSSYRQISRDSLESAVTLALSFVNSGPNKSLLNDTQNFLYSVSKTPGLSSGRL